MTLISTYVEHLDLHHGDIDAGIAHTNWYPKFLRHHLEVAAPRWAAVAPGWAGAYLTNGTGKVDRDLVIRSCLVGSPDEHLARIEDLRSLGVDNINAVPEPATVAALSLGALALIRRRRAR